jgi:hypothetical protein
MVDIRIMILDGTGRSLVMDRELSSTEYMTTGPDRGCIIDGWVKMPPEMRIRTSDVMCPVKSRQFPTP